MCLAKWEIDELNELCRQCRMDVITVLHEKQSGHPGGSLSACEILVTLLMKKMRIDPKNPQDPGRDRLVLSKGHAAPMLYRVLAEKGFFPLAKLHSLREVNSDLQGHPCMRTTPGVDLSSGPLGMGLSAALGMSLGLKLDGSSGRVYAVLGDGELDEGTVWEACMSGAKFGADNLCAILDWNDVQLDGPTKAVMPLGDIRAKFTAFDWHCIECDGHDVAQLWDAYTEAEEVRRKPVVILAHTVKGKGVSFMEGKNAWHGKAIDDESYRKAMQELEGRV